MSRLENIVYFYGSKEFAKVGRALFGDKWIKPLALLLKVKDKTIQRWSAGTQKIPITIWFELAELLKEKKKSIETILDDLSRNVLEKKGSIMINDKVYYSIEDALNSVNTGAKTVYVPYFEALKMAGKETKNVEGNRAYFSVPVSAGHNILEGPAEWNIAVVLASDLDAVKTEIKMIKEKYGL